MDVELRHLRAFVAVAQERSFTRAAGRLFVAQQALSKQIRQLEARVGAKLLDRTTHSVSLTPAGEVLFGQARLLLSDAAAAVEATRAAATRTVVNVGFVAAVDHADVSHALDAFGQRRPDVALHVRFGDLLDPTGGLRAGEADVAFVYGPFDRTGLVTRHLFTEPIGVAMAPTHPLASRHSLSISDVVGEATFDFPTPDLAWRDFWSGAAHRGGRPPTVVAQFRTLEGLVAALRAGLGVHLATRGLVDGSGGGLVWRELRDAAPLDHLVAHRHDERRAVVHELVDVVVATFAAA